MLKIKQLKNIIYNYCLKRFEYNWKYLGQNIENINLEIQFYKIVKDKAISAGIRRIYAELV